MRRLLIAFSALGLTAVSNAQLWDGDPLPPSYPLASAVDPYFSVGDVGGTGLTEFDTDTGTEFSLIEISPVGQ